MRAVQCTSAAGCLELTLLCACMRALAHAVEDFEADANRKPQRRAAASRRKAKRGVPPLAEQEHDDDDRRHSSIFDYDFYSDDDENAPVQHSLEASPAKGAKGSRSLGPLSVATAVSWADSGDALAFDGHSWAASGTPSAGAALRSGGLSLRQAAALLPRPATVPDALMAAPHPALLSSEPLPPPRTMITAPPRHLAAVHAETVAMAVPGPLAHAWAADAQPPSLPPPLPSTATAERSSQPAPLSVLAEAHNVPGAPFLTAAPLEPPPPSKGRRLARLDAEIVGMSVQQLKEKIRSVAATRRERLQGATGA